MKAFISYSVSDNNDLILTLLSSKLREKKFIVTTSQNFYSKILDFNTKNEIGDSHLFIGLITKGGVERQRVIDEWKYAKLRGVPNILLVEDTVPVRNNFKGNLVRFNHNNPGPAIYEINKKMRSAQTNSSDSDDIVPWILGGAALLAILALLSDGKK